MNEILDFIRPYISNEVFLLALVMGAFYLGIIVYKRTNLTILQPLLIAMIVIIPFLKITGIDYQTFYTHTRILNFMLGRVFPFPGLLILLCPHSSDYL